MMFWDGKYEINAVGKSTKLCDFECFGGPSKARRAQDSTSNFLDYSGVKQGLSRAIVTLTRHTPNIVLLLKICLP